MASYEGLAPKLKFRYPKSETNPNTASRSEKNNEIRVFFFVLGICFDFRASDFEFWGKAPARRLAGAKRMPVTSRPRLRASTDPTLCADRATPWHMRDRRRRCASAAGLFGCRIAPIRGLGRYS